MRSGRCPTPAPGPPGGAHEQTEEPWEQHQERGQRRSRALIVLLEKIELHMAGAGEEIATGREPVPVEGMMHGQTVDHEDRPEAPEHQEGAAEGEAVLAPGDPGKPAQDPPPCGTTGDLKDGDAHAEALISEFEGRGPGRLVAVPDRRYARTSSSRFVGPTAHPSGGVNSGAVRARRLVWRSPCCAWTTSRDGATAAASAVGPMKIRWDSSRPSTSPATWTLPWLRTTR